MVIPQEKIHFSLVHNIQFMLMIIINAVFCQDCFQELLKYLGTILANFVFLITKKIHHEAILMEIKLFELILMKHQCILFLISLQDSKFHLLKNSWKN